MEVTVILQPGNSVRMKGTRVEIALVSLPKLRATKYSLLHNDVKDFIGHVNDFNDLSIEIGIHLLSRLLKYVFFTRILRHLKTGSYFSIHLNNDCRCLVNEVGWIIGRKRLIGNGCLSSQVLPTLFSNVWGKRESASVAIRNTSRE